MTEFYNLVIEPLNKDHDRKSFRCGVESLDHYFISQAGQDVKRRISRVFVAAMYDNPKKVIGYYTLSSLSIELHQIPEKLAQKLPKYPIPAALIGRLAVSRFAQGNGIGKMLLADAIKRILTVSSEIAVYAVVVDAISIEAQRFYENYGLIRIGDDKLRLFLPLQSF